MEVIYRNKKVGQQCTSVTAAKNLFGGNSALAKSLLSKIQALKAATTIKDIIVQSQMHFHNLHAPYDGYFAIDVKSRRDAWRIILRPLNKNKEEFIPCNIDEIADIVEIVEIKEVSKHYE